ncbi:MAG: hypothetical protein N2381_10920, partial [Armatimonadetes bacterium]|nr:hypothetical protein [Armatimonadota bacterium]
MGKEAEQAGQKLVEWCARWEQHRSAYALRYFAQHLYDQISEGLATAKPPISEGEATAEPKISELFELARNEEFARTQEEVLPHEPDLPLQTLQLALDVAIKRDLPKEMAEMLLRHAKRVEGSETPLQAQERGEKERAIRLAKQRLERDYRLGTLWLLLLAWSWENEGEREWAKRCLDEISQWWKGKTLEKLGINWFEDEWQGETAAFLLGDLVQVEGWAEVSLQVLD